MKYCYLMSISLLITKSNLLRTGIHNKISLDKSFQEGSIQKKDK